jgi:uncharacterized protein (DUF1697 family)
MAYSISVMRYGTFLRGVNVGSHNRVKMEDLRSLFSSLGFSRVETYIQSGNIFFDSSQQNIPRMTRMIEEKLRSVISAPVPAIIRPLARLNEMMKEDPFRGMKRPGITKKFVCFLSQESTEKVALPFFSPNKNLEIVAIRGADLFGFCHVVKGRHGYPGSSLEKKFGAQMTTRFWETMEKMLATQNGKAG